MSICAKQDYEVVDEKTQNAYNIAVVKEVLKDAVHNCYNWKVLSQLTALLLGYENQIVRWYDDDGLGLAYPKDNDKIDRKSVV